jgi:FMN phosphatase YigB (HAD superfamily)
MKKIKLIIVDFDGPINDLLSAKKKTIIELCKKFHINLNKKTRNEFVNFIDHYYVNDRIDNYKELIRRCLRRLKKDHLIVCEQDVIESFSDLFSVYLFDYLKPNKKIISALSKTKRAFPEIKICIYTNQSRQYVEDFFKKGHLDFTQFIKVYSKDFFKEHKPSIKNLETICHEQDVIFNQTMMIGDDPTQDLLPAYILGMKTILFNPIVTDQIKSGADLLTLV